MQKVRCCHHYQSFTRCTTTRRLVMRSKEKPCRILLTFPLSIYLHVRACAHIFRRRGNEASGVAKFLNACYIATSYLPLIIVIGIGPTDMEAGMSGAGHAKRVKMLGHAASLRIFKTCFLNTACVCVVHTCYRHYLDSKPPASP